MKKAKIPSTRTKWSAQVMKTSHALDLEPGVFTWKDPHQIALSLKNSAEQSTQRKSSPLRSAMSMLTFHINRAGKNLPSSQKTVLEKAKEELRSLYGKREQKEPISRFHVMAVLQAARAVTLGLNLSEAKSWGLNRALFYAAAKQSWQRAKSTQSKKPIIAEFEYSQLHRDPVYVLGGEKAFRARNYSQGLRFKFGDQIQTPEDFELRIASRFGNRWQTVWSEALQIIRSTDRRNLDIRSRFFTHIYQPRRDVLAQRWSKRRSTPIRLQKQAA